MTQRTVQNWIVLAVVGLVAGGCSPIGFRRQHSLLEGISSRLHLGRHDATTQGTGPIDSPGASLAGRAGSMAMARLAERRDQTEPAERIYKAILEKDPNSADAYHRLAVISAKEGRFDDAQEYFAKTLELSPSDPTVLCDLGYSYYLQQRLEEAETVLDKALELKPNDPAVANNLALLYGEQQRYKKCLAMFRRTGGDAEAYANLGFIYIQHGELEKAKEAYGRALSLDRQLRPAAEAMVQLAETESRIRELAETGKPGEPAAGPGERAIPPAAVGRRLLSTAAGY